MKACTDRAILLCLSVSLALAGVVQGAGDDDHPSLTDVGPYETPSRHASGVITYNLGPTGARGWVRDYKGGTLFWGEIGREILITRVEPGSPADGSLQVFDVLVGADGETFKPDARQCLGRAIARAQRADGRLRLQRWRNGSISEVTLHLPRLVGDAQDAPMVADHSEALRMQFLEFLARSMHPDGFKMHASYASLNALFLLANGRPEHLDHVRRHIRGIVDDMGDADDDGVGPWNWVKGPNTTLLAEYFLATGDRSVLPALEQYLRWMRNSQAYDGGFGHGEFGGYGHVALPGLFNAVGAVLARECGITGYDDMIAGMQRFFSRAAGLGMMGYGGHSAGLNLRTIYGDNGKTGAAALFYNLLDDPQMSRTYANTACALAAYSESGHSGNFWSFSWGAVGATLGGEPNRKHFVQELDWYYALARTWDGGLTAQPWRAYMGAYARGGAELATGGMALWYARPLNSLRILGADKSVLSLALSGPLAEARQLIHDNRYGDSLRALTRFQPSNESERQQAEQLQTIAERGRQTVALTLASIQSNIDNGDLYTAERQVHALKPIVADASPVEAFERLFETDDSVAIIAAGKTYYDAMAMQASPEHEFFYRAPAIVFNAQQRAAMRAIADNPQSGRYAARAADALARWEPDIRAGTVKSLVDEKAVEIAPQEGPGAGAARKMPFHVDDPATLESLTLGVNASEPVTVSLNGHIVCRFHKKRRKHAFDSWSDWETVTLRPAARELLQPGENILGIATTGTSLGVRLQAVAAGD